MLISLASIEAELKGGFSFGVDGFFDYLFKTIELLAALPYFNSHWRLKAFLEIPNSSTLFKGIFKIKFYQGRL